MNLIDADNEVAQGVTCLFCCSRQIGIYWLPDSSPRCCHLYCSKCGAAGPWVESTAEGIARHLCAASKQRAKSGKQTKANLECADVILERNHLPPHAWPDLRRDIAIAITMAEQETKTRERPESQRLEQKL
jgi:hypothetical protein